MIEPDWFQSHTHGRGHAVVEHGVPSPRYTPLSAAHCAAERTVQNTPLGEVTQHAPRAGGGGQAVAVHVTPASHVPCRFAHAACVVTTQLVFAPVTNAGLQHAPRGTQMSFEQTVPLPRYVPPAAVQSACVSTAHAATPAALAVQHAPRGVGCGQVALVHTLLLPR